MQKRDDGFHDLETFFVPVNWHDALEILPSKVKTELIVTGIETGPADANLCLNAYNLLRKDYTQVPDLKIHLHKTIPIGAGLGGGSADAAFMLQLLDKKFNLQMPVTKISEYAAQLGSDCPFFLLNKPALAKGRGEILTRVNLSLSGFRIALVNPAIHISTAQAFANIVPTIPNKRIEDIILQPIETWKEELHNDFEKYVFEKFPEVRKIKEDLYNSGALYAAMSGSGSTVFGIFEKSATISYSPATSYVYKVTTMIE